MVTVVDQLTCSIRCDYKCDSGKLVNLLVSRSWSKWWRIYSYEWNKLVMKAAFSPRPCYADLRFTTMTQTNSFNTRNMTSTLINCQNPSPTTTILSANVEGFCCKAVRGCSSNAEWMTYFRYASTAAKECVMM